jgi:hypothetical protein
MMMLLLPLQHNEEPLVLRVCHESNGLFVDQEF